MYDEGWGIPSIQAMWSPIGQLKVSQRSWSSLKVLQNLQQPTWISRNGPWSLRHVPNRFHTGLSARQSIRRISPREVFQWVRGGLANLKSLARQAWTPSVESSPKWKGWHFAFVCVQAIFLHYLGDALHSPILVPYLHIIRCRPVGRSESLDVACKEMLLRTPRQTALKHSFDLFSKLKRNWEETHSAKKKRKAPQH